MIAQDERDRAQTRSGAINRRALALPRNIRLTVVTNSVEWRSEFVKLDATQYTSYSISI
jgi:hypothetical protein